MFARLSCLALTLLLLGGVVGATPDEKKKKKDKQKQDIATALEETLSVPYTLGKDNAFSVRYPLEQRHELSDFRVSGLERAEIRKIHSKKLKYRGVALEIGAGSRKLGKLLHKVVLDGDFEVRIRMMVMMSPQSGVLCFLLSKKVGVEWGQRIVKPSSLKPYNRKLRVDRTAYKEARKVDLVFTFKENKLTVRCDGKKTDQRTFKKGELVMTQIGLMARNLRVAILALEITKGTVLKVK